MATGEAVLRPLPNPEVGPSENWAHHLHLRG